MIRTDSRKVLPGDTFVALPGISSDGSRYIENAIENGAVRIICRSGIYPVDTIHTDNPREYLEKLLVKEYSDVISKMTLIALTGTNGKTTTCYLIANALNELGRKCAYIGTIGFYLGEKISDLPNTSVDICDLYELLMEAHKRGYDTVATEASSQGIHMGRLNTLSFDIAAFTNLTEDHLDYHKTMEQYAAAKQQLFKQLKPGGVALVNADDPYMKWFCLPENKTYTYGVMKGNLRAVRYSFAGGTTLTYSICKSDSTSVYNSDNTSGSGSVETEEKKDIVLPSLNGESSSLIEGKYTVNTQLIGTYNVYNTLAVIGVLSILGCSQEAIASAIEELRAPDGRCEVININGSHIVIDYAHTPDAISNILQTVSEFTQGRKYVVFGCTGDRERAKRPVMTQLVLNGCDYAILTDDDPHSEPEDQIITDMLEGNARTNYEICLNRAEAIRKGIDALSDGDSLLILGKGHENYIIMDGYKIPHNDKRVVLDYISGGSK